MEINTEQLEALLRQQEQQATTARRQTGQSGGFDAILAQQLGTGAEQANAAASPLSPGAAQAGMISQMLLNGAGQSQAADPDAEILQETQQSGLPARWIHRPQARPRRRFATPMPCCRASTSGGPTQAACPACAGRSSFRFVAEQASDDDRHGKFKFGGAVLVASAIACYVRAADFRGSQLFFI